MAKEDISLPVEMGKLEIEPVKPKICVENPFIITHDKKKLFSIKPLKHSRCICEAQKRDITIPIYKKSRNHILKEPKLKVLQSFRQDSSLASLCNMQSRCTQHNNRNYIFEKKSQVDNHLHTLVDNCNQLRISSEYNVNSYAPSESIDEKQWWKQSNGMVIQNRDNVCDKNRAGPSCSQEALNPPCDVTIDELASYFETLVHIPKKMSSMAEMMYN